MKRQVLSLVLLLQFPVWSQFGQAQLLSNNIWFNLDASLLGEKDHQYMVLRQYRNVLLNVEGLNRQLAAAPMEFTPAARSVNIVLSLPMPDGSMMRFRIAESPIMEPQLAAQMPDTKTYCGQGIDDPVATTRFSWTPEGFRAIVLQENTASFIAPYASGDKIHYISYYSREFAPNIRIECRTDDAERPHSMALSPQFTTGDQLRTYRLALAATGEFTSQYGGGNATNALNNAIIPLVNNINAIYRKEATIHFTLIANELSIIYTNGATDPYDNSNESTMMSQNQTNLDATIGSANYDIGHVLGTSTGGLFGIATIGVVCLNTRKALGATRIGGGTGSEIVFVSLVSHEWGHQFYAGHTFNGTTGNCGGQRWPGTAYEPGSGSTIMGYTTCGIENLQPTLDFPTVFHTGSIDNILTWVAATDCETLTPTGNAPPTISPLINYTVPQQTPFALTANASDPNGDSLTYIWEQYDLGNASPPNSDDGTRPIFRSYLPSAHGNTRLFPSLTYILNNANVPPPTYVSNGTTYTTGEALATTNRTLNFHVTVRDNRANGGGVQDAGMQVAVTTSSGPFAVTQPNTAVNWPALSTQTVTWSVTNTSGPPVNCSSVKISLSTDGGQTFPLMLAASTSNDGSETVSIPNYQTSTARVKVEAVGNIFFDISNVNFSTIVSLPTQVNLLSPLNGATVGADSVLCIWAHSVPSVTHYWFERAVDSLFTTPLIDSTLADTSKVTQGLLSNTTYWWRARAKNISGWGSYSAARRFIAIFTDVAEADGLPREFSLRQNYPNPFNPSTVIAYDLPTSGHVTLSVFDVLGREVKSLVNGVQVAGSYKVEFASNALASGVYLYRITAGSFVKSRKLLLLR